MKKTTYRGMKMMGDCGHEIIVTTDRQRLSQDYVDWRLKYLFDRGLWCWDCDRRVAAEKYLGACNVGPNTTTERKRAFKLVPVEEVG